jgi:hypothetical protein
MNDDFGADMTFVVAFGGEAKSLNKIKRSLTLIYILANKN